MHTKLSQNLLSALFLAAALLIIANAAFAFHAEQVLADSEHWVTHTLEVINHLEQVLGAETQAESSVRGFVLSGQERYLAPFQTAEATVTGGFHDLLSMTADNRSRTQELEQTQLIARQRLDLLHRGIEARRTHSGAEVVAIFGGAGEDLMSRLRDSVHNAEQGERNLLVVRLRDSARARDEAKFTVALASTLDILFVIFSLWSLGYERNLRQRASLFAARLEKLQSVTEVAFTQLTAAELTAGLLSRLRASAETDILVLCRWHDTEIEVAAAEGIRIVPGERRKVRPDGVLVQCARSAQPARLAGEDMRRLPIEALHAGVGSAFITPMVISGRVIGMLVAGRDQGATFTVADEELLTLAADRIALALDRAAAYDAERDARLLAEQSALEVQQLNAVLEERVEQRTLELATTNRELEAFSYSVSHDLRAPLRSVDGFSVALEEDYGHLLEGDGKHYLTRIRAGVQRMGSLIDALLQLSRITRAELSVENVDLSALASVVADDVAHGFPDRTLHFSIEPGLRAEGDPRLLRVIFENVFGNAAKFTGKTPDPHIHFGWSPEHRAFFVRDNGAGFDQQYAGKLFVAFQRLHGDKDFQGSGIGLATVARVVRRHHGNLWAEGAVNQGATFWFTLG